MNQGSYFQVSLMCLLYTNYDLNGTGKPKIVKITRKSKKKP